MASAIEDLGKSFEVIEFPMADGGEGSAAVLKYHCGGEWHLHTANDPLGRPLKAGYLALEDGLAVVEVARASGLDLLQEEERNPMRASSFGTGQLIAHALDAGHRNVLVTLGGSATNDGGVGMLSALGFGFLDEQGDFIQGGAQGLLDLSRIETKARHPALAETRIRVASDVNNPLLGDRGASRVFGRQKGASPEQIPILEDAMSRFGQLAEKTTGRTIIDQPGAGAAGGIGAALLAFTQVEFCSGFSVIAEKTRLGARLSRGDIDLVITGEGCLDTQTQAGKLPQAVARLANEHGIPTIAIAGRVEADREEIIALGLRDAWALSQQGEAVSIAINQAESRLYSMTQKAIHIYTDGTQG